jgi:hypothetical protein
VKSRLLLAVSALALTTVPATATAQMNMPGMTLPMQPKPTAKKRPAAKRAPAMRTKNAGSKKSATKKSAPSSKRAAMFHRGRSSTASRSTPMEEMSMPMERGGMQMSSQRDPSNPSPMPSGQPQAQHGTMQMPMPAQPAPAGQMTMPMRQQETGPIGPVPMQGMQHGMEGVAMNAALGPYPAQRESSGTAWQPDASSAMTGPMTMAADWMLMAHGDVNLVYDHQSSTRGDDKAFASGMLMGMAQHPLRNGTVRFRAMLSPDPLMGPSGYPLLLASGETANGRDRLIDRKHPHDFIMELSGSVSQNIGPESSVFLYAGLPGEPAFGPPAFMHRESILDSPEAPISHHWLDSTHITFGVVTAGLVVDRFKIEASRFNGREPDQRRWNIETGPLDSTSLRISWNPTRTLALQGSWAHLADPEQLEPGVNQTRWSASALWADDVAPGWHAAAMLAWGRKSAQGHNDNGFAAEASLRHAGWTVFGRGERVENRELIEGQDQPAFTVGKVSLGAVRDFRIAENLSLGAGGLLSVNFIPDALAPLYGGHNPTGAMGFIRLKLH